MNNYSYLVILLLCINVLWLIMFAYFFSTLKKYYYLVTRKNELLDNSTEVNESKIMSEEKENELLEKINEFEKGDLFTHKNFSMAQMSTLLESNPKYINYVLNQHKNINFSDYINQLRINYIVKKLVDNPQFLNYKISYLADLIGFSSNSRFAYIFKKQLNITPSEFISQLKKQNKL
ncbi:helix-turn-helix domain-containing protein [Empedobacter falsenii]|uniref:Helix-turn-helix domain-containing protein n=1 Tax=Empedobacter falsenii TaxID=343874 RepID=A0AAW7DE79_9FLAO|nr:helix-turn-helix domain-containing protein [Empedobacter falsenii]MDM1549793.1 helix-turn-helix domain-containing protein [Empedobacter falsenii]